MIADSDRLPPRTAHCSPEAGRARPGSFLASLLICVGLTGVPGAVTAALAPAAGTIGSSSQASLAAERGIGVITDREGTASRKSLGASRWRLAERQTRIEPGDWLRTGKRGANALELRLDSRASGGPRLVLGPGTLIEARENTRENTTVYLVTGELLVEPGEDRSLTVEGPSGSRREVRGRAVLRAGAGGLEILARSPSWLEGYENQRPTDALGSLLAKVDGRDIPLTLGEHRVTVDIRDQIARTEIQETFVNHTDGTLEGVFYFPLPAGASISEFAMWIDGALVHGEIVEKQRARAVYETLLREKRDPGVLEWTGGNIFKARVFPIHHEKRVKIAYTQVLHKKKNIYTYPYTLQSEMLRSHPLEELSISVKVSSTEKIADITCPSHPCRIRHTDHAARVEFAAREFSPEKDFELCVRTDPEPGRISVLRHIRDGAGYFMLLADAPSFPDRSDEPTAGADDRPLDLVVLADTSGSMAGPPRRVQLRLLEALLGSLGADDRLLLGTCDTEVRWQTPAPAKLGDEQRQAALRFVEERTPLGWSDLDAAFAEAIERAGAATHVIYLGDGILTTRDADPGAFAARLGRIDAGRGTFHAVATGSSYEIGVLRAIARMGSHSGSVHIAGTATDPARAADDLLSAMTARRVEDLELTFDGMSVAAVYPEEIASLAEPEQLVVVGRFDPSNSVENANVTLRGKLGGREIVLRGAAPGTAPGDAVADSDKQKNSFIPRFWARRHLDHLLAQGSSQKVRDSIVALSEQFQIITPYTSFLVLENDADRRRFQIEKRMRMRDAEEFFAEGRDNATEALRVRQMRAAKSWRLQLRARLLEELAGMESRLTDILRPDQGPDSRLPDSLAALGYLSGGGGMKIRRLGRIETNLGIPVQANRGEYHDVIFEEERLPRLGASLDLDDDAAGEWSIVENDRENAGLAMTPPQEPAYEASDFDVEVANGAVLAQGHFLGRGVSSPSYAGKNIYASMRELGDSAGGGSRGVLRRAAYDPLGFLPERGTMAVSWPPQPFAGLFPTIGGPLARHPLTLWPEEVEKLTASLDHRGALAGRQGGFRITTSAHSVDHRDRSGTPWTGSALISAGSWCVEPTAPDWRQRIDKWLLDGKRGAIETGWGLGCTRATIAGDEQAWPAPFGWYFGDALRSFSREQASLRHREDGLVEATFTEVGSPAERLVVVADPEKAAVREVRRYTSNRLAWTATFDGLFEAGGLWWPARITTRDETARMVMTTTVEVEALARDALVTAIRERLDTLLADAIVLGDPPSSLAAAKQALADGHAGLEDHLMMHGYEVARGRWDTARPRLEAALGLVEGKRGATILRLTAAAATRHGEELREQIMEAARDLAGRPRPAEISQANSLKTLAGKLHSGVETRGLLMALGPVYRRHADVPGLEQPWEPAMIGALDSMGHPEEAFAWFEHRVEDHPGELKAWQDLARRLAARGEIDEALTAIDRALGDGKPWLKGERQALRLTKADLFWGARRLEALVADVEGWVFEVSDEVDSGLLDRELSALIMLRRDSQALALIERWQVEARRPALTSLQKARLEAAVNHALGTGYGLYRYRIDPAQLETLGATVLFCTREEPLQSIVSGALQNWRFRRTDVARTLRSSLVTELEQGVSTLSASRVAQLLSWITSITATADREKERLEALYAQILERWKKTSAAEGVFLRNILLSRGPAKVKLEVWRHVLAAATDPRERRSAARGLIAALERQSWSRATQEELIETVSLLARLAGKHAAEDAIHTSILAIHDLAGWISRTKTEALVAALPDTENLSRKRLRAVSAKARKEAIRVAAGILRGIEERLAPASETRSWAAIERLTLEVELGRDPDAARRNVRAQLAALVDRAAASSEKLPALRDSVLAARCAAILLHLAATTLEEDSQEPDASIGIATDERAEKGDDRLLSWRQIDVARLMVFDRPAVLTQHLAAWYGDGRSFAALPWGRTLAHLEAERDHLERAVTIMEAIARFDELGHGDRRALADWHTALGHNEPAREARIASWETLDAWSLANRIRAGSPRKEAATTLDAELPIQLVALMRKAEEPDDHIRLLADIYGACRDSRVLECLADALVGHSTQGIYTFLKRISPLTDLIQEEATVDRLASQITGRSADVTSDADRRALALLRFVVEAAAADQLQGGGAHGTAALAALRAARKGSWQEGERELMADLLASRGRLADPRLASEQIGLLVALAGGTEWGSEARLSVAFHLAVVQDLYGKQADAIRTMEAALSEARQARGGRLAPSQIRYLEDYVKLLAEQGAYKRAERVWLEEIDRADSAMGALQTRERLARLYADALAKGAETSLGHDKELYDTAFEFILDDLHSRTGESHARKLVRTLCLLAGRLQERFPEAGAAVDLRQFAFSELPAILDLYAYQGGQVIVGTVAETLGTLCGRFDEIEFLVTRAENEPRWLVWADDDFWSEHANRLASVRAEVVHLRADIEQRLLALVTKELRRAIRSTTFRRSDIFDRRYAHFWKEQADLFARVAEETAASCPESESVALFTANYLFKGLDMRVRAARLLRERWQRGALGLDGRWRLCLYLRGEKSRDQLLTLAREQVEAHPELANRHAMLMRAVHGLGRTEELLETLAAAEEQLNTNDAWDEQAIVTLARACHETGLDGESVELWDKAITMHTRSRSNRGVGDGALDGYYREQSQAYAALGRIDQAIDAGAGAVVCRPRRSKQRKAAVENLKRILRDSTDIDSYATRLVNSIERTGLENPLLRKLLGEVYLDKKMPAKALLHLRAAATVQPNDRETGKLLVRALDTLGRSRQAVAELARMAAAAGNDIGLYRKMGERLEKLEQPAQAERAYTNIVEWHPNEAQGHRSLAEIREAQKRWAEAEHHWRRVIRIRTDEPTGYLGVARALLAQGRPTEAEPILAKLLANKWDPHFGDVHAQARKLK